MITRYSSHCFWNCATFVFASSSSIDIFSTFCLVSSILLRPFLSLSAAPPNSFFLSNSSLRNQVKHKLNCKITLNFSVWKRLVGFLLITSNILTSQYYLSTKEETTELSISVNGNPLTTGNLQFHYSLPITSQLPKTCFTHKFNVRLTT